LANETLATKTLSHSLHLCMVVPPTAYDQKDAVEQLGQTNSSLGAPTNEVIPDPSNEAGLPEPAISTLDNQQPSQ
jgi:hypothetical protein